MKFRYLVVFAALAFMASCSNEENVQVASVDDDAWVYDESLPVPVEFATPQILVESNAGEPGSKAAMTSNKWVGAEVGIFGLNREGRWDMEENVLLSNIKTTISSQQKITFEPKVYYPMSSEDNFNFYGYYPYSDNVQFNYSRCYEVTYDNIGTIDILWAKDTANPLPGPQYEGFNARYVRTVTSKGWTKELPMLKFEHMLTALAFNIKSADGSNIANTVAFTGLNILDIETSAILRIADTDKMRAYEGIVVATGAKGTIALKDTDESTTTFNKGVGGNATSVGSDLMLVPAEFYKAEILLTVNGEAVDPVPVTLTREGGFLQGNRYTITLLVKSPQEVQISTELTDWSNVDGGTVEVGD